MNYVDHFNLFGIDAKQIPCDTGEGDPTTATVGPVGGFYMNTLTGDVYKCVSAAGGVYSWERMGEVNYTTRIFEDGDNASIADVQSLVLHGKTRTEDSKNLCSLNYVKVNRYVEHAIEEIPEGRYAISAYVESDGDQNPNVYFIDSTGSVNATGLFSDSYISAGRKYTVVSFSKPINKLRFYASGDYTESQGHVATFADIQIEKYVPNVTPTEYAPHYKAGDGIFAEVSFGNMTFSAEAELLDGDGLDFANGSLLRSDGTSSTILYKGDITSLNGEYKVSTYGVVSVTARDKHDYVGYYRQRLTEQQKAHARENIGAASNEVDKQIEVVTKELLQINPLILLRPIESSMVLAKQWTASIGSILTKGNTISARGCCDYVIKYPDALQIVAENGYSFALVYLDEDDYITADIGWRSSHVVPANQRFVFNIWNSSGAALTDETAKNAVTVMPYNTVPDDVVNSIYVEYGRHDGATYNFVRIPKTSNEGATIKPVLALTSVDGSVDGGKCSALTYSKRNNLQFTINAGLFNVTNMQPVGQTIIDGVSVTNTPMADDNGTAISDTECYPLCIDANGDLSAPYLRSVDTATMIADGVQYAITGWGKLVDNFEIAQTEIDAEIVHNGKNYSRQCIGQFENGDYCVLTAWAGNYSTNYQNEAGMTYEECAQLLVDRGVKFAYSLDGGGSAETVIKKRQINPLYDGGNGRSVPTVITFVIE